MRVLVTGAVGFIGKYVMAALEDAGHEAIGLDLIRGLRGAYGFVADITQPLTLMPGRETLDAVIHLAALSHPRQCDENPGKAYEVNVLGTSNVLRMALASGAKKFVFSSSAHVYDLPPRYMPTDELLPLRLNNTYTTNKILGEKLCELYYENHGLSYTTLRLFNAYGNGQALGYFIPDIIARAKAGDFELRGANTTKDWIAVEDVARAFVAAIETSFVGAMNIGTGVETNLGAIASRIADAHGVTCTTYDDSKATRMCADATRARRILGWEPQTSIWEGLNAILSHEAATIPA